MQTLQIVLACISVFCAILCILICLNPMMFSPEAKRIWKMIYTDNNFNIFKADESCIIAVYPNLIYDVFVTDLRVKPVSYIIRKGTNEIVVSSFYKRQSKKLASKIIKHVKKYNMNKISVEF